MQSGIKVEQCFHASEFDFIHRIKSSGHHFIYLLIANSSRYTKNHHTHTRQKKRSFRDCTTSASSSKDCVQQLVKLISPKQIQENSIAKFYVGAYVEIFSFCNPRFHSIVFKGHFNYIQILMKLRQFVNIVECCKEIEIQYVFSPGTLLPFLKFKLVNIFFILNHNLV